MKSAIIHMGQASDQFYLQKVKKTYSFYHYVIKSAIMGYKTK